MEKKPIPAVINTNPTSADHVVIDLNGDWSIYNNPPIFSLSKIKELHEKIEKISFNTENLGVWDSSVISFLFDLKKESEESKIEIDDSGLPAGIKKILKISDLAESHKNLPIIFPKNFLVFTGEKTVQFLKDSKNVMAFVGEISVELIKLVTGRAHFLKRDLITALKQCGPQALPIITLISLLVGMILAFVGSLQLKKFGAEIYIANLVGIGMIREMGALMTAVAMTGRSGAAFAAELGSMQVNEEIDALTTFGISPTEFLVLPRLAAMILMLPLLCIYANMMGILGGAIVAISLFDLSFIQYINGVKSAVSITDVYIGLIKIVGYATLIGASSCLRGMQCGRKSTDVGNAVTSAVVTGFMLIILSDAIFTLLFNALGI